MNEEKDRQDIVNERLEPFMWLPPYTANKKLYWTFIVVLIIIEVFLGGHMFFK